VLATTEFNVNYVHKHPSVVLLLTLVSYLLILPNINVMVSDLNTSNKIHLVEGYELHHVDPSLILDQFWIASVVLVAYYILYYSGGINLVTFSYFVSISLFPISRFSFPRSYF
jgi:hypothetical protein